MNDKDDNEIADLVRSFESGAIDRAEWRHAEHLTVALFYVYQHDYETAYVKMRGGIFNLLKAFQVDLAVEMPYHETLTVFWLKTVDEFAKSRADRSLNEIRNELVEKFDKDYPSRFYSRERLFSDQARAHFVEADL